MRLFRKQKAPVILQFSETECGIASLAMLFAHHQVQVPIDQLRDQCGASRDGSKALTLINIAEKHGFKATAYSMDIDLLRQLTTPVIAYWNFNHYVVINYTNSNLVCINDPGCGTVNVSISDFERAFTGIVIDISLTEVTAVTKTNSFIKSIFENFIKKYLSAIIFLLLCLFINVIIPFINAKLYSVAIDQLLVSNNKEWSIMLILLLACFGATYLITTYITKITQFKICQNISAARITEIVTHLVQLPLIFYSLRQRGEIINRLANLDSTIDSMINNPVMFIISSSAVLTCLACMILIDTSLALSSILITLFYLLLQHLVTTANIQREQAYLHAKAKQHVFENNHLREIETVKACSLQDSAQRNWQMLFNKKITAQSKVSFLNCLITVLMECYHLFSLFFILLIGSYKLTANHLSIGNLLGYYTLHIFFYTNLTVIAKSMIDFKRLEANSKRIADIMLYKRDARYSQKNTCLTNTASADELLICRNLSFSYNPHHEPALQDINLNIKSNEHIALVGGTGSSKSTLLKILAGLFQPTTGYLVINNADLTHYSAAQLAQLCAYVPQEVTLFTGTILENLTLWQDNIGLERIYEAIRLACLDELIIKRGLYSQVEEGGKNFSGGERQRIDIARALIQNTPILLLDEATAALDYQTELTLINNLRTLNKTIIFVAHRLNSIQHCNQIIVLKNGKIVEHGDHHTLLSQKNYYYELVQTNDHADR